MGSGFSGKYRGTFSSPEGGELRRRVLEAFERAGGAVAGDSAARLAEALVRIALGEPIDEADLPEPGDVAFDLALDALSALVPGGPAVTRSLGLAAKRAKGVKFERAAGKAIESEAKAARHPHARDPVPSKYEGKLSKAGEFDSDAKADAVSKKFGLDEDGEMGVLGRGTRQFVSSDQYRDAEELFEILSDGAQTVQALGSGKGVRANFTDGTVVTYRWETNTPNSPAVQIGRSKSQRIRNQKVHFEKG